MGCGWRLDATTLQRRADELAGVERVLLKTDNADLVRRTAFQHPFAHLTGDGARYLRHDVGIRLVGIDYLSVDPFPTNWPKCTFPAHHALLGAQPDRPTVAILEGLDLFEVTPGDYTLWCLPLRLEGVDASPVRAVLARG